MTESEKFETGRAWLDKHVMPLVRAHAETLARGWVIDTRSHDVLVSGEICPCVKVRLEVENESGYTTFESTARGICVEADGRVWAYTERRAFAILNDYLGHLDSIEDEKVRSAFDAMVSRLAAEYSDPRRRAAHRLARR